MSRPFQCLNDFCHAINNLQKNCSVVGLITRYFGTSKHTVREIRYLVITARYDGLVDSFWVALKLVLNQFDFGIDK